MSDYKQLPLPIPPEAVEIKLSKKGSKAGLYIATVDYVDRDLDELNWTVLNLPPNDYAYRKIRQSDGSVKMEMLHRVILSRKLGRELLPDELVDHIDRNGLNNSRDNLRVATLTQNNHNGRLRVHNTSGHRGVHWRKDKQRWHAYINLNKKRTNLGNFEKLEDAIAARQKAEQEYFGEFRPKD